MWLRGKDVNKKQSKVNMRVWCSGSIAPLKGAGRDSSTPLMRRYMLTGVYGILTNSITFLFPVSFAFVIRDKLAVGQ